YRQIRVGRAGKLFRLLKLRTMCHRAEAFTGPRRSSPGDCRVTCLGRFLRRWHIDDLPQLWNVLRGDMSLVGPRPERPEFVHVLNEVLPRYRERLAVRPGMTGLAQVLEPSAVNLEDVRRKLAADLLYVEQRTLWLDLRLLVATAAKLIQLPATVVATLCALPRGQ